MVNRNGSRTFAHPGGDLSRTQTRRVSTYRLQFGHKVVARLSHFWATLPAVKGRGPGRPGSETARGLGATGAHPAHGLCPTSSRAAGTLQGGTNRPARQAMESFSRSSSLRI